MKNDTNQRTVYAPFIGDLLHGGHVALLQQASEHGLVTVGVYSDAACVELNDIPYLSYEQRAMAVAAIRYVDRVVEQNTTSFITVLDRIKPDVVVRGDRWSDEQLGTRSELIEYCKAHDIEFIEVPYTADINNTLIRDSAQHTGISTSSRVNMVRRLLNTGKTLRFIEAHNPLSALIVESARFEDRVFDGFWSSSLTDSASKGMPDNESLTHTSRLNNIGDIFNVTRKPMIYDGDTGGKIEHFKSLVRSLEQSGVSAVIIEDKTGLKQNSLFGNDVHQEQDTIMGFSEKIRCGKAAQLTKNFMIIARVESLILDRGIDDAFERAVAYTQAGADGIMIHSRKSEPDEIIEFIRRFRSIDKKSVLVVVPTTFNQVTVDEFTQMGVNIVIYANHLLRSAYPAMVQVANSILEHNRTFETESNCMPISKILTLIKSL